MHHSILHLLPFVLIVACSSDKSDSTDTSDSEDETADVRTEPEGTFPGECTDGADNDSDGAYDCDDSDCAGSPDCQGSQDTAESDCDDTGHPECPDDWIELPESGSCIQLQTDAASWQEAEDNCVELGGHLVTITNEVDDAFLAELLGSEGRAWIGYNDLEEEGTWAWVDGSSSDYENWGGANPDQDGDEDCAWLKLDFGDTDPGVGWGDQECDTQHKSFCMR